MAICERGYLCEVCGEDVAELTESDLYLRYVLGEVDPETLHVRPERHIRCNLTLAQFIVAEGFAPVVSEGPFAKSELDPAFVATEEARVTRGYLRLRELSARRVANHGVSAARGPARWQDPGAREEDGPPRHAGHPARGVES